MTHFTLKLSLLAAFLLFTALALPPGRAQAHEFHPERELMIQVFPSHIDVVILYTEEPGARSDLFSLQYGLRANPTGPLALLAERAVLPRVLDGLQFEVPGEEPRTGEPEVRVQRRQGRIMAAAFVRYELSELPEDETRTVIVRSANRSFLQTPTLIYAGEGMEAEGPAFELTPLRRGSELRASFRLSEPQTSSETKEEDGSAR